MAVRNKTRTTDNFGNVVVTYEAVLAADTVEGIYVGDLVNKSVQVTGTPGSATITLQGSNDGTNYVGFATAITFTAAGLKAIPDYCRFFKFTTAGGDGTSTLVITLAGTLVQ